MKVQSFIVSDESVNSYGIIIKTDGIDTTQFSRNPIMLYMHNRDLGVIGRWDNIRKDGDKLLMDAVFDESTELGRQVSLKVKNGYLRCASIGCNIIQSHEEKGVKIVTKCCLQEVSIVDIPANSNAMSFKENSFITLVHGNGSQGSNDNAFKTAVLSCLGLSNDCTDEVVINKIKELYYPEKDALRAIEDAISCGFIDALYKDSFTTMAVHNMDGFNKYIEDRRIEQDAKIDDCISKAMMNGRICSYDKSLLKQVASKLGYNLFSEVIKLIPKRTTYYNLIKPAPGIRNNWGIDEYRKFAPKELEDDTELYISLMKKEKREIPLTVKTLDYYRKNHPEYLKQNRDEYNRVLKESTDIQKL